jgi:hypothetical protein
MLTCPFLVAILRISTFISLSSFAQDSADTDNIVAHPAFHIAMAVLMSQGMCPQQIDLINCLLMIA